MGGRIYDPLAGRFTTADPILQSPYWSQGQNRYAYVFNDPINATDPSGFSAVDGRDVYDTTAGFATVGYIPGVAALSTLSVSSWGAAGGSVGGIGNVVGTLLANPFGSSAGGTYGVAAPSGAPSTNPVKPGGMNAFGQGSPPGPVQVQESADALSQRLRDYREQLVAGSGAGGPGTPYLPNSQRKPPGWNEDWPEGVDERGPYSQDPDGVKWYPHAEDRRHWDHYDTDRELKYPPNSSKPFPGQRKFKPWQNPFDPWEFRSPVPLQIPRIKLRAPTREQVQGAAAGAGGGLLLIIIVIALSPIGI